MTLFEKIINREIPASIVYEDADLIAFYDLNPQAPVHVLIVPKQIIPGIGEAKLAQAELLGKLLLAAPRIAGTLGVANSGYRVVVNHGADAGETIPHLHIHLLGGRQLIWPPG